MLSVDGPSSSTFRAGLNLSWNFSSAVDCQGRNVLPNSESHPYIAKSQRGFFARLFWKLWKLKAVLQETSIQKSKLAIHMWLSTPKQLRVCKHHYIYIYYIYIRLKNQSNTINSCLLHFLLGKHTPRKMDPPNYQFKSDNNTTMDSSNLVVDMTSPMPPNQDGFGQLHF